MDDEFLMKLKSISVKDVLTDVSFSTKIAASQNQT